MRLKINTDGGSRGNPGPAAAAVVINDDRGRTIFCRGYYLQKTTSNVAEYEGLLHALEEAQKLGGTELEIFSDSELIVRQVNGQYRVKKPHLKNYHDEVVERMDQFEKVTLKHVSRDQNAAADTLVNQALNAGRDIEGDVEDPTSNITDKPIRAAVNVNDIIQFRQTSPYREPICRDKDFLTELICLSPNQSCPIKTTGSKTTLTVIRGRGNLKTDSEKTPLKTGAYLLLGPTPSLEITADADEKLVLIVTQIS